MAIKNLARRNGNAFRELLSHAAGQQDVWCFKRDEERAQGILCLREEMAKRLSGMEQKCRREAAANFFIKQVLISWRIIAAFFVLSIIRRA